MMDMLKSMKTALIHEAHEQMSHLECVNAKELGEVIDMIKDLEEAMYYCTITKAMHTEGHVDGHEPEEHENAWDEREGTSHCQRKVYMEAKQMHHGKAKQLQELEKYMKDLSTDLVDMIEDASPEEKQYLSNRLSALATKIAKLETT